MANESYEQWVKTLQDEIEKEEGIKFGSVVSHQFANIPVSGVHGEKEFLGASKSEEIYNHLLEHGYIDKKGKIQDALKADIETGNVNLPESAKPYSEAIVATLTKVAKGLSIKKHEEKKTAKLTEDHDGKQIVLGPDFKALWDKIKFKTTYRVKFSQAVLIENCIKEIRANVAVASAKFEYKKVKVAVTEAELETYDEKTKIQYYRNRNFKLPDIITYLAEQSNLTRQTIIDILLGIEDKLEAFKSNPQKFIELAGEVIKKQMRLAIVDGISYQRIGDDEYYAKELFQEEELTGYLKDMVEAEKSVYDYVVCDSDTEKLFAEKLEGAEDVKLYAKLPAWFKIDTPLGSYNPDWAVLIDKDDGQGEQLYFVVETKSSIFSDDIRASEQGKINCGIEHFKALSKGVNGEELDNPAKFVKADNYDTFSTHL